MNINEHDKKEIKGCMKLLETIKDTSRDYVGTNGCLYQDITREELDLIVNEIERLKELNDGLTIEIQKELKGKLKLLDEIERLNNIINELDKLIEQYSRNDYYYKYNGKYLKSEIIEDLKELKENK